MDPILLEYQLDMKDALRQVIQENYIGGVREAERAETPLFHTVPKALSLREENLLPPPFIKFISLFAYEGQEDDYIGVVACHDFGIHDMHITILDGQGRRIESGEVFPFPDNPELWEYAPTARVPAGTAVTVHVTAIDCMGGIGRGWESKTLGA